jgi:sugar-specific transcriptional regulator TrmB
VYVYLAKKGPHEEKDLANALKLTRHQLCLSLETLLTKKMVRATPERSIKYCAIALEKILDEFMKAAKDQAKALQVSREKLISTWRSMEEKDSSNS